MIYNVWNFILCRIKGNSLKQQTIIQISSSKHLPESDRLILRKALIKVKPSLFI